METLLTPTESLAFQSFLSSMDNSQPPGDWASYSSQFNPSAIRGRDNDEIVLDALPPPRENDSLTKATKDLMSLDAPGWSDASMMPPHPPMHQHQQMMYDHPMQHHQQHQQHQQPLLTQPLHRQHSFSSPHDSFPFLNQKSSYQQPTSPYPQQHNQHNPYGHSHPHHLQQQQQQQQQQSLNHSHLNSPTSPSDMYAYQTHHQHHPSQPSSQVPLLPTPLTRSQSQGSATNLPSKRPVRSSAAASRTSLPAASASSSGTASRQRVAPSTQQPSAHSSSQSPHPNGTTTTGSSKPALLSPSQKKANHIQSEQKRRANIRRGYEALCETVPALREAIREEEEEARLLAAQGGSGALNAKGKAAGKKRAPKKKDGDEGPTSARDKIDGRAGPRSENVVLSKTIDYINDLLSEKSGLLTRLERARSMLPPGHPGLTPLTPNPPWEREWKGGEGKFGDEEEEEAESEAEAEEDGANGSKARPRRGGASNTG